MSGFSASWLALREPYDRQARGRAVLDHLAALFAGNASIAIADLGCGTGATMRAISSALPRPQSWRLVENDENLLAHAAASTIAGTEIIAARLDLARELETAVNADVDLVTVSALLDLVSAAWLDRLIETMVRLARPLYAALTYNGEVALAPAAADDATIITAVNRHQLTDKGFGPALVRGQPMRQRADFAAEALPSSKLAPTGCSNRQMRQCSPKWYAVGLRPRPQKAPPRKLSRAGSTNGVVILPRAAHACASVTSISSPSRSDGAERKGRNQKAPRCRGHERKPAAARPVHIARSARDRGLRGRRPK